MTGSTEAAASEAAPPTTADERIDTRAFSLFEWMLARRYLRARRKEGFISVIAGFSFLGIMLGVATLIIVMAVMNGFRAELFSKIFGINGHVIVGRTVPFDDYAAATEKLVKVPGVTKALPVIDGLVLMSSAQGALGGYIRGMTGEDVRKLTIVSERLQSGTLEGFDQGDAVAIGVKLAQELRIDLGDEITLVTPRGATTPFGTAPRTKRYRITAVFNVGMAEYDKTMVLMPLAEAKKFLNRGDAADVLEVFISDPETVDQISADIRRILGPGHWTQTWKDRHRRFAQVLEVERNVMFLILSLIVLVAALNIVSGMVMLVKEKGRDIAILRTMGATRGAIMRIFLITGASIGIVGTLAGLVLGVVFVLNIESIRQFVQWITGATVFDPEFYYLLQLPAEMNPRQTAGIVGMALALSVAATIYPSWRASRLDPVEALRYE